MLKRLILFILLLILAGFTGVASVKVAVLDAQNATYEVELSTLPARDKETGQFIKRIK